VEVHQDQQPHQDQQIQPQAIPDSKPSLAPVHVPAVQLTPSENQEPSHHEEPSQVPVKESDLESVHHEEVIPVQAEGKSDLDTANSLWGGWGYYRRPYYGWGGYGGYGLGWRRGWGGGWGGGYGRGFGGWGGYGGWGGGRWG